MPFRGGCHKVNQKKLRELPYQHKVFYVGQARDVYKRYSNACMNATMFYCEVTGDINKVEKEIIDAFKGGGIKLENINNAPKVKGGEGYVYVLVEYSSVGVFKDKRQDCYSPQKCKTCDKVRKEMYWMYNQCSDCHPPQSAPPQSAPPPKRKSREKKTKDKSTAKKQCLEPTAPPPGPGAA